jgi:hypothetical protein
VYRSRKASATSALADADAAAASSSALAAGLSNSAHLKGSPTEDVAGNSAVVVLEAGAPRSRTPSAAREIFDHQSGRNTMPRQKAVKSKRGNAEPKRNTELEAFLFGESRPFVNQADLRKVLGKIYRKDPNLFGPTASNLLLGKERLSLMPPRREGQTTPYQKLVAALEDRVEPGKLKTELDALEEMAKRQSGVPTEPNDDSKGAAKRHPGRKPGTESHAFVVAEQLPESVKDAALNLELAGVPGEKVAVYLKDSALRKSMLEFMEVKQELTRLKLVGIQKIVQNLNSEQMDMLILGMDKMDSSPAKKRGRQSAASKLAAQQQVETNLRLGSSPFKTTGIPDNEIQAVRDNRIVKKADGSEITVRGLVRLYIDEWKKCSEEIGELQSTFGGEAQGAKAFAAVRTAFRVLGNGSYPASAPT